MKKQLIVLVLLLGVFFSCKKEGRNTYKEVNSTVIYAGEPAADGCGWLIRIDNTANNSTNAYYSPINLTDDYKKNNLSVIISYSVLNTKFQCGSNPNSGTTQIQINAIRKR